MTTSLRDFVPPIVVTLARRFRTRSGRKRYATYDQARNDCRGPGYQNPDIVALVVEKTRRYRDTLAARNAPVPVDATSAYGLCSLLASVQSDELHVLDFGGAAGAHYFLARTIVPSEFRLKWVVVETHEMARGAEYALGSEELTFTASLTDAVERMPQVDLVHTSGSLQFVDNPCEYLKQLVSLSAEHILLNRLGITRGADDVITIHESWLSGNGPGPMPGNFEDKKIRYPAVFPRESAFLEILAQTYDTIMTFNDSSGVFPVRSEPIIGYGLLARRRR